MLQKLIQIGASGGISPDAKSGIKDAGRFMRFLDIHSDSDSVSLLPKPTSIGTTTGLVKAMASGQPFTNDKFAIDDAGHFYELDNDVVTDLRTVSGCAGQGLIVFEDNVFYAGSTKIGRYGISTASFNDDYFGDGVFDLDLSQSLSGQTYTTPTSIAETSANKIAITPTKTPLKSVKLTLTSKGTGSVTVRIHDADNISLGSVTVATGDLVNGENTFTFSSAIRLQPNKDYHIHVTSTVADTTVQTGTTNDLSTAWYRTYFGILFADDDYHPMILHTNGVTGIVAIGNGNYIATYDNETYLPNKIAVEPGYKIRGWAREDEFIVAYCWKGTNIEDNEEGKMFYWDGISNYYNFVKPITGGQPNSMVNFKNRMFSVLGTRGSLAIGTAPFIKLQEAPLLARGKKVEVMPNAMCVWNDRIHIGYGNTDDTAFEQGIFEFGSDSDRVLGDDSSSPEVLNYAYRTSPNDTTGTDQKIGCLFPSGQKMYIGWKNGASFGIDRLTKSGNSEVTGSFESLIIDYGFNGKNLVHMPQKTKLAVKLVIVFTALPAGCTVTPKFRKDRAASFTDGSQVADETDTRVELDFGNISTSPRYKEIEVGYNIVSTGSFPTILGWYYVFDDLRDEADES